MPWTEAEHPPALAALPGPVREKALEIANGLLDQGYPEDKALRLALADAREWADQHWEQEIDWDDVGLEPDDDR